MLTKSKAILKLIAENPELAQYIEILENFVKLQAKSNKEWSEDRKRKNMASSDLATKGHSEVKKFRSRELTNEEKCNHRNKVMLNHYHDLCDKHENPSGYGVRKKLRDQTYEWAIEQGYFTNEETREERIKQLKSDPLKYVQPKPK